LSACPQARRVFASSTRERRAAFEGSGRGVPRCEADCSATQAGHEEVPEHGADGIEDEVVNRRRAPRNDDELDDFDRTREYGASQERCSKGDIVETERSSKRHEKQHVRERLEKKREISLADGLTQICERHELDKRAPTSRAQRHYSDQEQRRAEDESSSHGRLQLSVGGGSRLRRCWAAPARATTTPVLHVRCIAARTGAILQPPFARIVAKQMSEP
jgi:hypothetical protein